MLTISILHYDDRKSLAKNFLYPQLYHTGSCCDLETCTVRPISYPCRSVQDSQCDLPETCDGDSEWCPIDTYRRDGTECTNIEQGYCYEGKCNTHSSQCQLIWGVEHGARKSDDFCYKKNNNASMINHMRFVLLSIAA